MESTSPIAPSDNTTPRRKVKAAGGFLSAGLSSPSSTSTDGQGRIRKKQRLTNYFESMAALNVAFAKFTKESLHSISLTLENGDDIQPYDSDFVQVSEQYIDFAAGIKNTFLSSTGGTILTFGTNEFGQIAQSDDVTERKRPAEVKTMRNQRVIKVSCGGLHNMSVTEDGKVDTWGCNDEGSLGCIEYETAYAPVRVTGFIPSAKETAVGLEMPLYTWCDLKGSRGGGNFTDPKEKLDSKYEERIVSVVAGDCHSLALSSTGRVYFFGAYKDTEGRCWGDIPPPDDPRIHPKEKERNLKPPTGKHDWPIHVWQLGAKATEIACGFSFSAALVKRVVKGVQRTDLFTWGMGQCGELSRPVFAPVKKPDEEIEQIPEEILEKDAYATFNVDKVAEDYMPPKLAQFADGAKNRIVEKVAGGGYHMLVIAKNNEDGLSQVYSCGLNNYGQSGHSAKDSNGRDVLENIKKLTKIDFFDGMNIHQIAGGEHFSICLDSTGRNLYGFGRSCSGQLGNTLTAPAAGSYKLTPVQIYLEYNADGSPRENPVITEISCGSAHSFAMTEHGDIYSWGYGLMGALGVGNVGDEDCVFRPQKIDVTRGINAVRVKEGERPVSARVQMVAGGAQHSAMVATLQQV